MTEYVPFRLRPTTRNVPLTNGILYPVRRRPSSDYDRQFTDRFASTSTSSTSPYDTDSNAGYCSECRKLPNGGRNRFSERNSMPKMGYALPLQGHRKVDVASEIHTIRRRRKSRSRGLVESLPFVMFMLCFLFKKKKMLFCQQNRIVFDWNEKLYESNVKNVDSIG